MPEIVMSLYRPHPGKDAELRALIARHIPALRKAKLITDRTAMLMRSSNGTYIEVFEWNDEGGSRKAHETQSIQSIWGEMMRIAEFPSLDSLDESKGRFPHFEPV